MKLLFNLLAAFTFSILSTSAFADGHAHIKVGDLMIMKPEIRATVKSAPVSAGYLKIKNTGNEDDTLLAGTAGFAGKVQLHNMEMVEGVMRMRPVEGGIVIPAGGEVTLAKGGLHIMFMKLEEQMKADDSHKVTLKFAKAGEVEVEMNVVEIGAEGGHSDHGSHGHSDGEAKTN